MDTSGLVEPGQSSRDIADWNNSAQRYSTNDGYEDPTQNPMYLQIKAPLWESLGNLKGLNVLDLGCGHGWLSGLLDQAGANLLGTLMKPSNFGIAR